MNQLTDPRVQAIAGKLKWGLGIAAVLLGGLVAWAYTVSLAMIAIAGTATLIVIHGAPWASQKIANFFLNMRKKDARDDPVTNRERIGILNREKLTTRKQEIEALDAEVRVWEKEIANLPPEEAKDFTHDLATAQAQVEAQALAWKAAEQACDNFDAVTARVARKWKVAQTGMRIKKLSQQDKEDRINVILAAEAAESADRQLANAFSSLDSIVARAKAGMTALPNNPSPVIDVDAREIAAKANDNLIRVGRSVGK